MNALLDFLPIVLFFVVYRLRDIYWATGAVIIATTLMVGVNYARTRKLEKMPLITLALIVGLGGATLVFRDKRFIMWKPTIAYWLFAGAFIGSQFVRGAPLVQRMLDKALDLPPRLWTRLNIVWALFFLGLGALNLVVFQTCSEAVWVNFKLFGLLGALLLFTVAQGLVLHRYLRPVLEAEAQAAKDAAPPPPPAEEP